MISNMIAPSILSADFADMKNEIDKITQAGANLVHVDVMDGHFVPNLTIGMPVVKSLKKVSSLPLDVHLMIEKPERYIEDFVKNGASYLTVHVEATDDVLGCIRQIKKLGAKAGITLKPKTSIENIKSLLSEVDLVLVMTVEPGFGGQTFMHDQVHKIDFLKKAKNTHSYSYLIEVDGGINEETAQVCWKHGADILVAGSAVFNGEKTVSNYQNNILRLKGN